MVTLRFYIFKFVFKKPAVRSGDTLRELRVWTDLSKPFVFPLKVVRGEVVQLEAVKLTD